MENDERQTLVDIRDGEPGNPWAAWYVETFGDIKTALVGILGAIQNVQGSTEQIVVTSTATAQATSNTAQSSSDTATATTMISVSLPRLAYVALKPVFRGST